MKKTIAAILCAVLCLLFAVPAAAADTAPGGAVVITDRAGLEAIADNPGGSYVLAADIDLSGAPWAPIDFSGTLDGAGHTLYNLTIREAGAETAASFDGNRKEYDTAFAALFSRCAGAAIQNLTVLGADVRLTTDQNSFASILVGWGEGVTLTNCSVSGRVYLETPAKMCGVGGLMGFGYGTAQGCAVDAELTLVDTNDAEKCEEFLGGMLATGYLDMDSCTVKTRGFASVSGYVHNGGVVGMYYVHTEDTGHQGYINNCIVDAVIDFYENNTDRRAYCSAVIGEQMHWVLELENNTVANFESHESKDYTTVLLPETCAAPVYAEAVTAPTCAAFGHTAHTCGTCGYSYTDAYTAPAHQPGAWVIIREATAAENGLQTHSCTLCGAQLEEEEVPLAATCTLSPESLDLAYKKTAALTAGLEPAQAADAGLTYTSSDTQVARVDGEGTVTATGPGTATITCQTADGATADCAVSVHYSFGQWLILIFLFGWIWY